MGMGVKLLLRSRLRRKRMYKISAESLCYCYD